LDVGFVRRVQCNVTQAATTVARYHTSESLWVEVVWCSNSGNSEQRIGGMHVVVSCNADPACHAIEDAHHVALFVCNGAYLFIVEYIGVSEGEMFTVFPGLDFAASSPVKNRKAPSSCMHFAWQPHAHRTRTDMRWGGNTFGTWSCSTSHSLIDSTHVPAPVHVESIKGRRRSRTQTEEYLWLPSVDPSVSTPCPHTRFQHVE